MSVKTSYNIFIIVITKTNGQREQAILAQIAIDSKQHSPNMKLSQVTFIIAILTILIVSKQIYTVKIGN